jgi:hypothetical protein
MALAARQRIVRALATSTTGSDPDLRPGTSLVIPSLPDDSRSTPLYAHPISTQKLGRDGETAGDRGQLTRSRGEAPV